MLFLISLLGFTLVPYSIPSDNFNWSKGYEYRNITIGDLWVSITNYGSFGGLSNSDYGYAWPGYLENHYLWGGALGWNKASWNSICFYL